MPSSVQDNPWNLNTVLKVAQLCFVLALPVVGWMFSELQDHSIRIVRLEEAFRHENKDLTRIANTLEDMNRKLDRLNTRITTLEAR